MISQRRVRLPRTTTSGFRTLGTAGCSPPVQVDSPDVRLGPPFRSTTDHHPFQIVGVEFESLQYGTSLGFASIGTNAGHDGQSGEGFLNAPEVLNDWVWRAVHLEAITGKKLIKSFYGSPVHHSYFTSCSNGGRQGIVSAQVRYDAGSSLRNTR